MATFGKPEVPARALPRVAMILAALSLAATLASAQTVDYADPDYGCKVRQLRKDDGHEHNLYYYRDPWNADGSRLVAVQSDLDQKHWRVCLYDGDGGFIKELFPIERYDWRVCWDRRAPEILYTLQGSTLVRLNVATGKAEALKSFAPQRMAPSGVSLNQAGDRILVVTSDKTLRSYHLPDMSDERTFKVEAPAGCTVHWDKVRYTGYGGTIDVAWSGAGPQAQAIAVYDDAGKRLHTFDGIGGGGHYDYSPDGKLAYFKLPAGGRGAARTPFEIHVVNLDGTGDRVLFSLPAQQVHFHNLHLSWPRGVNDWFIASFFPMASPEPAGRSPRRAAAPSPAATPGGGPADPSPVDEIVMFKLDGAVKRLAHTGTVYSRAAGRGEQGDMFWAQPLGRPSADGRRICFNSSRSGTVDLCILHPAGEGKR